MERLRALMPLPEPFGRAKALPAAVTWMVAEPVASQDPTFARLPVDGLARALSRSCVVSEPVPAMAGKVPVTGSAEAGVTSPAKAIDANAALPRTAEMR